MQSLHESIGFPPPRYTYEDYKHWDEDWELIDGYAYSLRPHKTRKHQHFATEFIGASEDLLFSKPTGCQLIMSLDWIIDDYSVVRPDGLITNRPIETDYLMFPPTFILEIVSPLTAFKDEQVKFRLYEMNKVKYYVMADIEKKSVAAYELINGFYQPKNDNNFQLKPGVEKTFDFDEMWG